MSEAAHKGASSRAIDRSQINTEQTGATCLLVCADHAGQTRRRVCSRRDLSKRDTLTTH